MIERFLMVRRGCPFCRDAIKVINKLNMKLSIEKQIRIIDCYEYEELGLKNIPLMKTFEDMGIKEGYPFLIVNGFVIEPAPTPSILQTFLIKFLKEDLVT